MTQPSGPSARDIAEAIIDDIWPNWSTCQHLAKEYLAIESRCKRLEAWLYGVAEIAKYLAWHSDIGNQKAQEIIDSIHQGKYGSNEGIWLSRTENPDDPTERT